MFGLSYELLEEIKGICANLDTINKLGIYGSRARGDYGNLSDIDLVIYGYTDELDYFTDYLNSIHKISIVMYDELNGKIISEIDRDVKIIYDKSTHYEEYKNFELPVRDYEAWI